MSLPTALSLDALPEPLSLDFEPAYDLRKIKIKLKLDDDSPQTGIPNFLLTGTVVDGFKILTTFDTQDGRILEVIKI